MTWRVMYHDNILLETSTSEEAILYCFDNGLTKQRPLPLQFRKKYGQQDSKQTVSYAPGIRVVEVQDTP